MRALDRAKIPGPDGQEVSLVLDETHAVHIYKQGHRVAGDLLRVSENAKGTVVAKRQPGTKQKVAG